MWNQFDIVQIIETKRVKYLSGPKNRAAPPSGYWSIVGFIGADVLLARRNTLTLVPVTDIRKVAGYDIDYFLHKIKEAGWRTNTINVVSIVSKALGKTPTEAQAVLSRYNFPTKVKTDQEVEQILLGLNERGEWDVNSRGKTNSERGKKESIKSSNGRD